MPACSFRGRLRRAAVARVEEGRVVRASGFDCPVYVLGLPLPEEMSVGVNEELILPVDDTTNLRRWRQPRPL